ncbi:MAG: LysR substrate-binding domain-containing protein [Pseudobdellovibrionaceae bacterium]
MAPFHISLDDCQILRAFLYQTQLISIARLLDCDVSGLQKKVARISKDHGFLHKVSGHWELSETGRNLATWMDQIQISQSETLHRQIERKIATRVWIAEQLLIPNLKTLNGPSNGIPRLKVQTTFVDLEASLLKGLTDFVIACTPPNNPSIIHRVIGKEDWIAVAPITWKTKILSNSDIPKFLASQPFIRHCEFNAEKILGDLDLNTNETLSTDSFISIRSAIQNKLGWSYMPRFAVLNELKMGTLFEIPFPPVKNGYLTLWWMRDRKDLHQVAQLMQKWLGEIIKTD